MPRESVHFYSVGLKGLSRVARIEFESSVIGQLAVCGQAVLLAVLCHQISKPNKLF